LKLLTSQDAADLERHLEAVLDRHLDAPGLKSFKQMICGYVMAGGKRVRPQLTAWVYRQAMGDTSPLPAALLDTAAGWELFHAFLLVHDDIIDESPRRREQAALHFQLAGLDSNSIRFGTNLGIVAGDLLFSAALCVWHDLELDPATHRDLLRLISKVACTTGFGQAIDICVSHLPMRDLDQTTLLREYHWKTAAYTFEGPMLSGAILAGLGASARSAISAFALALGQAYQLQNDLLDLARPADEGCDLVQGKRTVTLLQYRTQMDDAQRSTFDARVADISRATGETAVGLAERLRCDLVASDVTGQSRKLIEGLLNDARRATASDALPPSLALGMNGVLDDLMRSYFVPVLFTQGTTLAG
jgi:geranylgeranyl diphosphate synthase, type I